MRGEKGEIFPGDTTALFISIQKDGRLGRWLAGMEKELVANRDPLIRYGGRVVAASGGVLKARLPRPRLGEVVVITTDGGRGQTMAEVLSFANHEVFLAPLELAAQPPYPGCPVHKHAPSLVISVGDGLLGRVVDSLGRPMDDLGPIAGMLYTTETRRPPLHPLKRHREVTRLHTGIRSLDTLCPLAAGQRVALFSPAGVGKTSLIASMAASAQADCCVLCLVGERGREIRELVEGKISPTTRERTTVVCATSDVPPLAKVRAVECATTIAEFFRSQGKRVLLLVDSLTRYARALRDLALAAGEPQGRRGYPASVSANMGPLLERAGPGVQGSITAIYSVLVEDQAEDDPLAEEVRSLVDGHIIMSLELARRRIFPAIDPAASVSRLSEQLWDIRLQQGASRFKRLWACLESKRDLVEVGAYVPGADPLLDEALSKRHAMERFLCQPLGHGEGLQSSRQQLLEEFG